MSYLQQQMQYLKFDKRLLEINLKSGAVTKEEYSQHVAQLNDDMSNSEKMNLENEAADTLSDSMNGHSHPAETTAEPAVAPVTTPTNSDPFGSGY